MEGRLTQLSPGGLGSLLRKMLLERNRLLDVKGLEVPVPGALFKPAQRFRGGVYGRLTVPFGFLQIGEVFPLDPLVFWVVFHHDFTLLWQVTVYGGLITLVYLSFGLHKCDGQFPLNLWQFGETGAPVDHRVAVRAYAQEVPQIAGNR